MYRILPSLLLLSPSLLLTRLLCFRRHVVPLHGVHAVVQIMNPEKMRTEYGKLVYLLQDSCAPHVRELLEFECVRPVKTVRRRESQI